jgi:hypothetical protein
MIHTGMESQRPVIGGERPASRARYAMTPAKFAPEEMPPTRKPAVGEAWRWVGALAAAYMGRKLAFGCGIGVSLTVAGEWLWEDLDEDLPTQ